MTVEIYGIRHHGPGSARAVRRALEEFKPDAILIEGPPEADPIVELAADSGMVPPVALLAYVPAGKDDDGRRAAFWPFAEFSPEWQAIRYAAEAGVPARFCDLPAAHQLADDDPTTVVEVLPTKKQQLPAPQEDPPSKGPTTNTDKPGATGERPTTSEHRSSEHGATTEETAAAGAAGPPGEEAAPGQAAAPGQVAAPDQGGGPGGRVGSAEGVRVDPLGWLARAAGYDDAERWWDDVVEHRADEPPFAAIAEAMTVLREHAPATSGAYARREEQREAYMRRTLRRTLKEGYERVAVVCGAWHVPAIQAAVEAKVPAGRDDQTLRGLPKVKVAMTWVPWTHGRLANWSGYGAGVRSPGWYHHLFTAPDRPIERWLTDAARLLREEDLHVSSAHVIEAVRLADALAALRDRPLAGLDEVTEAARAVLCEGAELPLELIQRRLVVGERLGSVPDRTPMVPLQRDLQAEQRRLRLKPAASAAEQDLDLRKPTDLDRSRLLHRLRLLGVEWGVPVEDGGRSKGTFRESWTLLWRPEFDVDLIEASAWGTTVRDAATAKARVQAIDSPPLAELTALAERCLLADLSDALPTVMRALSDRAAVDTDVAHLMSALPALVRALRYGDVRGTGTGALGTVVDGLIVRICVGLPPAASSLDDDAARALLQQVDAVQTALALLADTAHLGRWYDTLADLIDRQGLHGLLEGRLTRLLLDAGRLGTTPVDGGRALGSVADRMARAVSVGVAPARAAAWVEGFLSGGALILIHDDALLRLVDGWIAGLPDDAFTDVLPLLRRTFGEYAAPERRALGERAARIGGDSVPAVAGDEEDLDLERAESAGRAVLTILGWASPADDQSGLAAAETPRKGRA